ncbi:MAG TPA: SpoVR family protein, partial [Planctomycetia bacterium]|nr:SpoVR family protein [Planctomycetia bacterium]
KDYGLDCFPVIFELVDWEEVCAIASQGGFPVRYPHWRFGMEFEQLSKSYSYGLSKIYEMVINNDPCYAYLMDSNALLDQKLVMAHVYGHCDFFKNNHWFSLTNRKMMDETANHGARIRQLMERHGETEVEDFIDICLSIEDLIDPHLPFRAEARSGGRVDDDAARQAPADGLRFDAKDYMESFVNPRAKIAAEAEKLAEAEKAKHGRFPEEPQRDVLKFLLECAPLKGWQRDVLGIIRDEAYYFAPQGQTKIMNEGWASYWHSTIMCNKGMGDADIVDFADHHAGTMAMGPGQFNPYKIGIELFRDIEERWDQGRHGKEWDECADRERLRGWDKKTGAGRAKIFEVRRTHNDVTFIDAFLTEDFCRRHKLFSFAYNRRAKQYEIESREFAQIKERLLFQLANHGRPYIYVEDANFRNRKELYLRHKFLGVELKLDYAQDVLANLQKLWSRPVHLETALEDSVVLLSFDGTEHHSQKVEGKEVVNEY